MSNDQALAAELDAAEDRRCAAAISKDREALEALLAPDLQYVHTSATLEDRDTYIERACTGWYDYRVLKSLKRDWRIVGDMAMCNGDVQIDVVVRGTPKAFVSRYLQVWRRGASGWQLAALQSVLLPQT
jgi:ketosteroid isomerase-like protein